MFSANRLAFSPMLVEASRIIRTSKLSLAVAVCLAWIGLFGFPPLSSAQLPPPPPTPTGQSICDIPQARGTATYNRYCLGGPVMPTGPTAEELEKRREARDTKEAADDAEDRGEALYQKGEWADAVKAFQESLDYDPDNDVASANLRRAQDQLERAEAALQKTLTDLRNAAAKQAVNAQTRAVSAAGKGSEPASVEARKPFDDADMTKNNGISVPVGSGEGGYKDPVVPAARRTEAITKLEQQRTANRKQRAILEDKLKALDPKKDSVAISAIKQKESTIDSQVNYENFSIKDQLRVPATVPPASTAK